MDPETTSGEKALEALKGTIAGSETLPAQLEVLKPEEQGPPLGRRDHRSDQEAAIGCQVTAQPIQGQCQIRIPWNRIPIP